MKERFSKSSKSLDSLKKKVEFAKGQARLLEDLFITSEARENKLKEELKAS